MKRIFKSKLAIVLLTIGFLTIGTNVYANSVLNTTLINLIQSSISSASNFFSEDARGEVKIASEMKQDEAGNFIDVSTDNLLVDFDSTKKSELQRAKSELDAHYNELVSQTENTIENEKKKGKDKIKNAVDEELAKAKNDISADFEKKLTEKMDEIKNGNNGNNN